ncbi:SDR family NAD(P)-dependent oxidoreductase [Jatrophihabitans lederbergiae]|uniref:SDR family oxidoreductase n=1 Tax=Jatrophihabitans lederbergiae TaxID=3075547 RepID=A0ABU2JGV9_9ACTN|nr:SDR family oxidoreductase [Jatrophihabitans sp. DSM 44399]MDT0264215.1 SDR family oxidoreductase [Jatrophihabitans sp. DSM 44399]
MTDSPVAIVTGSSSGIGATIAARLTDAGYRVVVNSARSEAAGEAVTAKLDGAIYVRADISQAAQARELVATTVDRLGRLDLLVNNAGITKAIAHSDLESVTAEVWRAVLDVNVVGAWEMITAAVPHLRRNGDGAIVNISSVAGSRPAGSSIPYAVSKAAINHMTRLLAATLGPEVRVNAVAPGLIDTEWTASFTEPREWMATIAPLKRVGTTDDVATMVLSLAQAKFTTGEVILVDGGTHLR